MTWLYWRLICVCVTGGRSGSLPGSTSCPGCNRFLLLLLLSHLIYCHKVHTFLWKRKNKGHFQTIFCRNVPHSNAEFPPANTENANVLLGNLWAFIWIPRLSIHPRAPHHNPRDSQGVTAIARNYRTPLEILCPHLHGLEPIRSTVGPPWIGLGVLRVQVAAMSSRHSPWKAFAVWMGAFSYVALDSKPPLRNTPAGCWILCIYFLV